MNISAITNLLQTGECREIEGFRCFIVPWSTFSDIFERLNEPTSTVEVLSKKYGYENFELRLSSLEQGTYYVCAKSEPELDILWNKKFRGGK
jgi:hypothetical protein